MSSAISSRLDDHQQWLNDPQTGMRLVVQNADLAGLSARNVVFRDAILKNVDLSRADLSGSDFARAELTDVNLSGSVLQGAYFDETRLTRVEFHRCSADDIDLSGSVMEVVSFDLCSMVNAKFIKSRISRSNFSGAKLADADMYKILAMETSFSDVDLTGANLSYATFRKCNFRSAQMLNVKFVETRLSRIGVALVKNLKFSDDDVAFELFDASDDADGSQLLSEEQVRMRFAKVAK